MRGGRTTTWSSRRTAPIRASAMPTRPRSESTSTSAPTSLCGSARPKCSTPSPSRSRKPSTAGSGPTPIASRPTVRPSSSNVRRRPGRASASTGCRRTRASPPARNCSPNISTATASVQRIAPRRLGGMAQLPPHQMRALGERQCHPARRRGAHRAFLDRLGDQARARGCDQAGGGAQPRGPAQPRRRRSTNIRPSETSKC